MIELKINGKTFSNFVTYGVILQLNKIASTFSFSGLENFYPDFLTYPKCEIFRDNELLITGNVINESIEEKAVPTVFSVSGYSLPGILEDCNIPSELYPLQSDNRSIKDIFDYLLKKFNIKYIIKTDAIASMNKPFDKSIASVGESVKSYLNKLISQNGLLLLHNNKGRLIVRKSIEERNITTINNIISYSITAPGQQLHSHVTILRQASIRVSTTGETTLENKFVKQYRPLVKVLTDGDNNTTFEACKNVIQDELSKIKLVINTTDFVKPATIIKMQVKKINIEFWYVENVDISGDAKGENIIITCVPAKVYDYDKY